MKIVYANRKAPDGTPRFVASHLVLFCLPMSLKKNVRFKWVKEKSTLAVRRFDSMKREKMFYKQSIRFLSSHQGQVMYITK